MPRKSTAALCLLAVAILLACSRNGPPSSLFEAAGYHVRDGKVYYLNAFPGKAFEINGADAATYQALDSTYWRARRIELRTSRPRGFAMDRDHVSRYLPRAEVGFRMLGRRPTHLLPPGRHRRGRPADFSRRPGRHQLL